MVTSPYKKQTNKQKSQISHSEPCSTSRNFSLCLLEWPSAQCICTAKDPGSYPVPRHGVWDIWCQLPLRVPFICVVPSAPSSACCFQPRHGTQGSLARLGIQVPVVLCPWTYRVPFFPGGFLPAYFSGNPLDSSLTPAQRTSLFLNLREVSLSLLSESSKPFHLLPQTYPHMFKFSATKTEISGDTSAFSPDTFLP